MKWVTGLSYRLKIPLALTVVIVLTEAVVTAALLSSASAELACSLVVTLGVSGVLVATGGEVDTLPAYPVQAIDTVGAGDAFVGGLAAALASGAPLRTAVRWGAGAGALTATVSGARHSRLDRGAVEKLISAGQ